MEIENVDYVKCKICGKILGNINKLHLRIHQIDTEEYLMMFPGSIITPSKLVEKRSQNLLGKPCKFKDKISESNKKSWQNNPNQGRTNKPLSFESRQKLSEKLTGHTVTEETRKKISDNCSSKKSWNMNLINEN